MLNVPIDHLRRTLRGPAVPRSSVTTFLDPYIYQEAVRSAQVEVLVTSQGDFRTELTQIDLHNLSMQRGRETLPRVGRGAMDPDFDRVTRDVPRARERELCPHSAADAAC
jgi:hypothetical protein